MRKLNKSELKRVYGAGHDNGKGNSADQIHDPADSHLDPHTNGAGDTADKATEPPGGTV